MTPARTRPSSTPQQQPRSHRSDGASSDSLPHTEGWGVYLRCNNGNGVPTHADDISEVLDAW